MVRHSKRHSRKKGGKSGKRSRSRRQYGGMWRITEGWKSLITADENVDSNGHKGIDIKYKGSPPNRRWLIGGDNETFRELIGGAKDGRYKYVMERILVDIKGSMNYDQKGVTLTDAEFCKLLNNIRSNPNDTPQYPHIYVKLQEKGITLMCLIGENPPPHMLAAQRPSAASAAPPHPHPRSRGVSHVSHLLESYVSGNVHNHEMQNM